MNQILEAAHSRRGMLKSLAMVAGGLTIASCTQKTALVSRLPIAPLPVPMAQPVMQPQLAEVVPEAAPAVPQGVRPELFARAMAALESHGDRIPNKDTIAIADFDSASVEARMHFIDLKTGVVRSMLVAHGIGSDPEHTGMLHRFSNDMGSNATCEGAFLAADYYVGKHGQSQRLIGLDATNSNALERGIVVHSAWYSNPEMIALHGKLGRSEGCFAVGERELSSAFQLLGQGRMIYASKV